MILLLYFFLALSCTAGSLLYATEGAVDPYLARAQAIIDADMDGEIDYDSLDEAQKVSQQERSAAARKQEEEAAAKHRDDMIRGVAAIVRGEILVDQMFYQRFPMLSINDPKIQTAFKIFRKNQGASLNVALLHPFLIAAASIVLGNAAQAAIGYRNIKSAFANNTVPDFLRSDKGVKRGADGTYVREEIGNGWRRAKDVATGPFLQPSEFYAKSRDFLQKELTGQLRSTNVPFGNSLAAAGSRVMSAAYMTYWFKGASDIPLDESTVLKVGATVELLCLYYVYKWLVDRPRVQKALDKAVIDFVDSVGLDDTALQLQRAVRAYQARQSVPFYAISACMVYCAIVCGVVLSAPLDSAHNTLGDTINKIIPPVFDSVGGAV